MKESVALAKDADAKKDFLSTRSDNSIHRVRNEPEKQLGSLRSVIGNIRHDGGTLSVGSIATELSGMHTAQCAPVLLALQRTHGNQYVQQVVTGIQAKLKVGQPRDKYEQEADRVADAVMQMPEPRVLRQPEEEEEFLQTKELTGHNAEIIPDLESRIQAIKGGGQPLPESVRIYFEPRFGYDLSPVRVHTSQEAAELAAAIGAQSFTVGNNVIFGDGMYRPASNQGRKLIAHELVHVLQQDSITRRSVTIDGQSNRHKQQLEEVTRTGIERDHVTNTSGFKKYSVGQIEKEAQSEVQGRVLKPGIEEANQGSQLIQRVPVSRGVLIGELRREGLRRLDGRVKAEEDTVNKFYDELTGRMEDVIDFWSVFIGGGGAAAIGVAGAKAHPVIAAFGAFFGALAIWYEGGDIIGDCKRSLENKRMNAIKDVEDNVREFELEVTRLATEFGNSVAEGDLDTDRYTELFETFAKKSLSVPSIDRVKSLKWNQLCDRWNRHVMSSDFYWGWTATAEKLLMKHRPVKREEEEPPPLVPIKEEEEPPPLVPIKEEEELPPLVPIKKKRKR